ncbi:MAG: hypothetical protein DRI44_05410 [Chlamydiae bacterium]|nr:MAG: hypothetical protein DRI44_05410 [Chlamydiota bacterium]
MKNSGFKRQLKIIDKKINGLEEKRIKLLDEYREKYENKVNETVGREIEKLLRQRQNILREYKNKAKEMADKIRKKVDLSDTDFEDLTQDILNCYFSGKNPVKHLKAAAKKTIKYRTKEIEKLKKFLNVLDKIGGEK